MSALEHYAAPSHVAPSGGFATGDASKEDTGKENRDRYHWNEWDLTQGGGWLRDWLELNMDQKTIYDSDEYLIRLRNCYRDTGEAVINQRKGKMFATYNLDLMVKWYACHRIDGKIIGECRGRFKVTDFSSEHCLPTGLCKEGSEEEYVGTHVNEGEWEFKKSNAPQGPGADQVDPKLRAPEVDISDAEAHLKTIVGERGWLPVRERLTHLHRHLAKVADAKRDGVTLMPELLPELECDIALREKQTTDRYVKGVKAGLRNTDKFAPMIASVSDRTCAKCDLRCLSLSDADMASVVEALPPKNVELGDGQVGLESIDLSYNEVTDSGVQKLMFALAAGAAPHLKQLNVHKTSITEVSRRQLAGLKLLRKGLSVLVDDEDKNCLLAREL